MRVLLFKIQCPSFICFCKPSSHIYASGSLKLDSPPPPPQVSTSSSTTVIDGDGDGDGDGEEDDDDQYVDAHVEAEVDHVDGLLNEVREEEDCAVEEKEGLSNGEILILKSSLKKASLDSADGGKKEKKKVHWVDVMGKELAEIREFESSEEDVRYDGDKSCVCVIL